MGHGKWGRQGLEVTWGESLHALGKEKECGGGRKRGVKVEKTWHLLTMDSFI